MASRGVLLAVAIASAALPLRAAAVGESAGGFPSYEERVQHQLANRARVDPQLEMSACGANCGEAACYTPQPPLAYRRELNRAARFHAAHMRVNGYFAHDSSCTLVADIDALYPDSCGGAASCACVGGVDACSGSCTDTFARIARFDVSGSGEIIASGGSPESAFYLWLYEPSASPACSFSLTNGHRWLLLTASGAVGFGADGRYVGDFGSGGEQHPIPSGSHWPRQAASVEAWASWADGAAPGAALVNLDGACTPMALARGTATNGAWLATLQGVGSGCHRYYYLFRDAGGAPVTYPETGSLGIGPAGSCADWSEERPAEGAGCAVPEPSSAAAGACALAALLSLARTRAAAP